MSAMKNYLILLLCMLSWIGSAQSEVKNNEIRIMSYNVRNCRGMDDVESYQQISRVINRCAPTVVAIQELDSATTRSGKRFVLQELATKTGMNYTYAPAIDFQGGGYGIGILSKEKPVSVKRVSLPGREEARMLLICDFGKYVVACSHLSLTPEDQQTSAGIITEVLKGINKPVFLAGDMNSEPESDVQKAFSKNFTTLSDPKEMTFPSNGANICIDYIYTFKNKYAPKKASQQKVLTEETVASDHLPLFIDVNILKP